jgi:hypothetical protein
MHMVNFEKGMVGDVIREIPTFTVKYKDVFSLKNLYIMMHELLLEEGWMGFDGEEADLSAHSDIETLYSENVYQKGIHHGGKEMWLWWRSMKDYAGRSSSYFLFTLDIDWHIVSSQDIEIVHQGKKMNTQRGEIEIFFKPRIMSDVGHSWEKSSVLKHFKHIYEHRIMHPHIEKMEKTLWRDVYRVQSKIKAYLNLRTWMATPELFHAKLTGFEGQF